MLACAVCAATMRPDHLRDTWRCAGCGFYSSTLPVRINAVARIDEARREQALKSVRMQSFATMLAAWGALAPPGARVLDVGCAHGWFLDAVAARGWRGQGLEPDRAMAARSRAGGHDVVEALFPEIPPGLERFDIITFNDVFEHLPDPVVAARALPRFLTGSGLVALTLPVSDGPVFRLSRLASRFGMGGPLARLWQVGLPSPHLSYFSADTLVRLFTEAGFDLIHAGASEAIPKAGLFARIRYDRTIGPIRAAGLYVAARLVRTVTSMFPSDIQYFVFRLGPQSASASILPG